MQVTRGRPGSVPCDVLCTVRRRSENLRRERLHIDPPPVHDVRIERRIPRRLLRRTTMLDWLDYRKELQGRIGEISKLSPDILRGYQTLAGAGDKTNHLDAKTRQLIALAVAVTTRCDGCITVHTGEALKHGATREEITEALGVAIELNAGAALVYSARVMDAVEAHTK